MNRAKILTIVFALLALTGMRVGIPLVQANTPPPWTVSLDANSTDNMDANPQTTNTVVKSFNIGAVVNASSTQPINGVYGWQFSIVYDNTTVVPQGDPVPGVPNDAAQNTAGLGAQTSSGNPNWVGMVSANHAFATFIISPIDATDKKITILYTILAPNTAVNIFPTLSSTVKGNLLANVAFELITMPSSAVSFSITDVTFVYSNGATIPNINAGPPVTVTINNKPPAASFTTGPLPRGDASCTPVTRVACSAFAMRYDGSSSSASAPTSIANPGGYFWDFGDGSQDNINNPGCGLQVCNQGPIAVHDYGAAGIFNVTLRVLDSPSGATGSARDSLNAPILNTQPSHMLRTVTVGTLGDKPPVVSFTESTSTAPTGTLITLTITATDTDSTPVTSIKVIWGDGTIDTLPSTAPSDTHSYAVAGTYTLYVNATDTANLTGKSSISTFTITNPSPSPIIPIAGALAILAVAGLVGFLYWRRRKRHFTRPSKR